MSNKDASIPSNDDSSNADNGIGSSTVRSTESINDLLKDIGELEATAPDYGVGK